MNRLREAARRAPTHPALRWTPLWDPANRAQHARNADGTGTACGILATLVPSHVDDVRCPTCFPTP